MWMQPDPDACRTAADVRAAARRVAAFHRRLSFARGEAPAEPVKRSGRTTRSPSSKAGDYAVWAAEHIPYGAHSDLAPLPGSAITVNRILLVATEFFGVTRIELCSPRKSVPLPDYRACVYWCAREMTHRSLPLIGKDIGGRDHTTILYGVRKVEEAIRSGAPLAEMATSLKRAVLNRFGKQAVRITVSFGDRWPDQTPEARP